MILYIIPALIIIPLAAWLVTFIYTSFRGSPYVPIKEKRLRDITQFIKKGDRVADLGCGDGRVLVEAIKKGATQAEGWESDLLVFLLALKFIRQSKVDQKKIKVHFADMWHADLSSFNVIYAYQMTKYMGEFKNKLLPQLKKDTLIISPDYKIPGMRHHKHIKDSGMGIYVYKL